jgi:exopolysaccharide biosynthesis polyprenyl glycosylphosphotransferase
MRLVGSFYLPGEEHSSPEGVPCLGASEAFTRFILNDDVDSVVLCPSSRVTATEVNAVLEKCDEAGVRCFYAPDFFSLKHLTSSTTWFGRVPAFTFHTAIGTPVQLGLKRAMDIVGASIGLILCMPLFVGIAAAIRMLERGPILFRQVRLGKDGKRFYCYKFRSMRIDAEQRKATLQANNEADGPTFKMRRDPRVTTIGRVLRKYSLDELPQLFNVLKGDMSLVGPRPPVPDEVGRYLWWQRRRISVRPGMTCVWQVEGRNSVSFEDWMRMDLFYIDNWSLWMDVKLMLRTMPAVVRGTGV